MRVLSLLASRKTKAVLIFIVGVLLLGLMLPENRVIPVEGASDKDWNHNTFWHEPWGKSGVHKGIDIFASIANPVISSTHGLVLYRGKIELGGNVVVILGPKWRIHYYAHLKDISVSVGQLVDASTKIGSVGDSGNAKGKQPHLHYAILTLLPYIWRVDTSSQGWKKMLYLDPSEQLLR